MKKIVYFDILKIISIIFVILIHVLGEFFYIYNYNSFNYKLIVILESICRFSVPMFYMISGALFLNENKKITIKDMLKKYLPNILLLYIFWNTTYSIIDTCILKHETITLNIILQTIINTILGHKVYQFGFLIVIIGFYLCVPILRLITNKKNKKELEYLIILLLIFSGIIDFLPLFTNINISYPILFSGYIIYFILGYYLSTFELSKRTTKIIYILSSLSLISTILITIYYSNKNQLQYDLFMNYLTIFNITYSCGIFIFIKNITINIKDNKIIKFLKDTYFGIFAIHGLILGLCYKLKLFELKIPLIPKIILITIIIYLICLLITYIMKKIPIIKKLVRG